VWRRAVWSIGDRLGTLAVLEFNLAEGRWRGANALGGTWNLPHSETHTIVLPHVVAYNYAAAPQAMMRIERAMGNSNAANGIFDLMMQLDAPLSLKEIGMRHDDLDRSASLVMEAPYYNPRSTTCEGILRLLDDAFFGRRPK
jgi:maleylacetate reductase